MFLNLPNPTFFSVLIINPNMEFIGTRQQSRFWWVKVGALKATNTILGLPRIGLRGPLKGIEKRYYKGLIWGP